MRCAACGHIWLATPEEAAVSRAPGADIDPLDALEGDAAPAAPNPAPRRNPADMLRAKTQRKRRRAQTYVAAGAWGGVAAAFVAVLTLAYAFRVDVVRIWPQTASAYAAVGLDATTRGLVFERLVAERSFENGEPVLQVSATVRNTTSRTQPVPYVRVSLRDTTGGEVFGWTVSLETGELDPRASTRFTTRVARPPLDAEDMELRFVDEPRGRVTPAADSGGGRPEPLEDADAEAATIAGDDAPAADADETAEIPQH